MAPVLPPAVRRRVPDRLRHSASLRALALRAGLIPPRTMHSPAEAALLRELAAGRHRAVEIGVYEGSSALVLIGALRAVVRRAARRRGGPAVRWHVTTSEAPARTWSRGVDLVFVDRDHAEAACRLDWGLWHRFVIPGGVVAFHDARGGDPGPTAVVGRLFGGGGDRPSDWSVCAERDTIMAVR
jgi:predicted O-methyltransferase YrrM